MSATNREWLKTFADPAILSDLFAAARDCMGRICDHENQDCDCVLNQMTPGDFAEFVELEVQQAKRRPVRFEPAGRPGRKNDLPPEWSLSAAG